MRQKPLLIQTSDPFKYYDMLQATSRTVRRYCEVKGYDYEQYIGIRRGYWPWQATFNRVYLLKEIMDRPREGWCLYMDADAYVQDLNFDLEEFLYEHNDKVLIATPSGASDHIHDINAGVFAVNMAHKYAPLLISKWCEGVNAISDSDFLAADNEWPINMPDDQVMLQWIIRDNLEISNGLYRAPPTLMNAPGASFIRQYLRALDADLAARVSTLHDIAQGIISSGPASVQEIIIDRGPSAQHYAIVESLYKAILRRPSDAYGRQAYAQMLFERGVAQGISDMVNMLLNCEEYKAAYQIT